MKTNLNQYRLAGGAGGLLLAAGQFWGPLCVLQLFALIPVILLTLRDRRLGWAALAGLYMGIASMMPQMIYLRMPVPVIVILLLWITILLITLCMSIAYFLPSHVIIGPLTIGAVWYVLDWINYTVVPIWGMAQSFARSWTAYPFAIQFISITGISGVLFVIAAIQGLTAHWIANKQIKKQSLLTAVTLILIIFSVDAYIWFEKPTDSIKVAAAGWVFDDRSSKLNPNEPEGFKQWFAVPARQAAAEGAQIFTTGEMGFYIVKHDWNEWMDRFSTVARQNNLWLVVGYFNVSDDENRIFFMSPQGQVVHEYTKTHLTPFEPGQKGNGDLKTIKIDDFSIGAMICQDDNFSKLTRYYGNLKADIVLCPTADWWTIKNAHLQAVRARAIECNWPIVRGAACGISAAISARGRILAKRDHYRNGPGYVIADVPIYNGKTFFSRFGHWPSLMAAGMCIGVCLICQRKEKRRRWHTGV